jgi:tetrahydromethanopterin S-methyltransferase subunit A
MVVKVKGVYENGVVYLTEPLPADIDEKVRQEVEVAFEPVSAEEAAALAELEKIQAELTTLGEPKDDTPEERKRRVELIMRGLEVGPPMSAEVESSLLNSLKRPMSMFTITEE